MARLDDIDPSLGCRAAAGRCRGNRAEDDRDRGPSRRRDQFLGRRRHRASDERDRHSARGLPAAGKDADALEVGCFVQVALTDADDSAREAIRGLVVTHARFSGFEAKPTGKSPPSSTISTARR